MHDAGVRGVRFNFVKRLVDATPKEAFIAIAEKIQEFGWSIVVYFEAADLEELEPFLKQLPGIVVVDHLGRPDVTKGVDHPDFARFIDSYDREREYLDQGNLSLSDLTSDGCAL